MKRNMKQKVMKVIKQFLGLFPTSLPVGINEFETWSNDIISTYDLPTIDNDSVKFTLSTVIMHLGPQASTKPKYFFVRTLRAASAKQVAGYVFSDIKKRHQEQQEKAARESAMSHETKSETIQ